MAAIPPTDLGVQVKPRPQEIRDLAIGIDAPSSKLALPAGAT